jgi:hypothetical protein
LANWRGDITAIMTPAADTNLDGAPDGPGVVLARVRYDAYGKPMMYHPADFDRDGLVGGSLSTEYTGVVDGDQHDYGPFEDVLALAPFADLTPGSPPNTVDAKLRAWRAWVNIANLPPPSVAAAGIPLPHHQPLP